MAATDTSADPTRGSSPSDVSHQIRALVYPLCQLLEVVSPEVSPYRRHVHRQRTLLEVECAQGC